MVSMQFGIFWTNGQICSATSRLLLQDSIADRFLQRLKLRTEEIKVGNPLEQDTRLGPVVSNGQYQKVLGYIEVSSLSSCARHSCNSTLRRFHNSAETLLLHSCHT